MSEPPAAPAAPALGAPALDAPALDAPALDDCWNRIGVRGDASCAELARHVHCRNCPVYAAAASDRLDIALTAGQLARSSRHVARETVVAAPHTISVVVFRIGTEWLALPAAVIGEIVGQRPIHGLPHRRDGVVLGLANIRGQLFVCAALRQILRLDAPAAPERDKRGAGLRMLVLQQAGACTVYPVDEVHGVQRFSAQDLLAVPNTVTPHIQAVLSWQGNSVGLLNEELLLATVNRSLASATAI
jgi:chemotaxis-related protein WspD